MNEGWTAGGVNVDEYLLKLLKRQGGGGEGIAAIAEEKERQERIGKSVRRHAKKKGKRRKISCATVSRFLEFGTSKMAARPFMTPAFESTKDEVLEFIISDLKDALGL